MCLKVSPVGVGRYIVHSVTLLAHVWVSAYDNTFNFFRTPSWNTIAYRVLTHISKVSQKKVESPD